MEKKCYFCEDEIEKGEKYWEFPENMTTCLLCLDIVYENFRHDDYYQCFKIEEEYIQKDFEKFKNEHLKINI